MLEYWCGLKGDYKFPQSVVKFRFKTDTDLFEFVMVSVCNGIVTQSLVFAIFLTCSHVGHHENNIMSFAIGLFLIFVVFLLRFL